MTPPLPATHAAHARTGPILATLALAASSYAMLTSLVAPALPTIQHAFGSSTAAVAWIFTAYLLSASIATPIAGRIGDMIGRKRTFLTVIGISAVGFLIAALATTLPLMIAGRAIQGIGGAVYPLAFGIIRDEFPPQRVAGSIAWVSGVLGIGGGLGVILAGPITDHLSYHWIFWIPLIVAVIVGGAAALFVPESRIRAPGRINWLGAGLLSSWLVCLLLGVSQGPRWGWASERTLGLFAAAAVLVAIWIRTEARSTVPLVDMRMMRLRAVWTTNATAVLIGMGMFGSFLLIPQFVEAPPSRGYGFSASVTHAGLFLLPLMLSMLVVSPITGRISNTVGAKVPLVLGTAVSAVAFGMFTFAHDRPWEIYVATGLMGVGVGLAFASMTNLIIEAVPREQTSVGSGMNTIMRTIGSSIGAQASASILAVNLLASGRPSERSFTLAFGLCAGALVVATGVALTVPRRATRLRLAAERMSD